MKPLHELTDAEWAIVGPAAERAVQAQEAVNRLVALFAVAMKKRPNDVVLRGRVLYGLDPKDETDG